MHRELARETLREADRYIRSERSREKREAVRANRRSLDLFERKDAGLARAAQLWTVSHREHTFRAA